MDPLKIVLAGSSIIQHWGTPKGLPSSIQVVNRGRGGSLAKEWMDWIGDLLHEEKPDAVILYCGSNDLNEGYSADATKHHLAQCIHEVHHHPNSCPIAYFDIIKAPQKADKFEAIDDINGEISRHLFRGDLRVLTNDVFLKGDEPIAFYFVEDQLHLTPEAYEALSLHAVPRLTTWLEGDNGTILKKITSSK
jgi:lysophospholipase L1-like esterase